MWVRCNWLHLCLPSRQSGFESRHPLSSPSGMVAVVSAASTAVCEPVRLGSSPSGHPKSQWHESLPGTRVAAASSRTARKALAGSAPGR